MALVSFATCHTMLCVVSILMITFYLEAGRRWWQVLILTQPPGERDAFSRAIINGSIPRWYILCSIICWLPVMALGQVNAKIEVWRERRVTRSLFDKIGSGAD